MEAFLFTIDFVFFTDIILNFFTTYGTNIISFIIIIMIVAVYLELENVYAIGKDVMYEHKHEKVVLRYLHGMFLIDLVSTVPFEVNAGTSNTTFNLNNSMSSVFFSTFFR